MKIHLLRHGESESNIQKKISCKLPGARLTSSGKRQAQLASNKIKKDIKNVHKIYISPFQRTVETYVNLNIEAANAIPIIDHRIKELDYGLYDGLLTKDIEPELQETLSRAFAGDNNIRFGLKGENEYELINRIYSFVLDVINKKEDCLAVTHDCVIVIIRNLHAYLRGYDNSLSGIKNVELVTLDFNTKDIEKILQKKKQYALKQYSPYLLSNKKGLYSVAVFHPSIRLPNIEVSTPFTFPFNKEGQVCLSFDKQNWWNPLGGHIEKGESWEEALVRESYEEAGIHIKDIKIFGYIEINELIKTSDSEYPPKSIIPITTSRFETLDDEWVPMETKERKCFTIKEATSVLSERCDNNQMLEVFNYLKEIVVE